MMTGPCMEIMAVIKSGTIITEMDSIPMRTPPGIIIMAKGMIMDIWRKARGESLNSKERYLRKMIVLPTRTADILMGGELSLST